MSEAGAVPELIKGAGQWGSTSVKCWNMRVGVKLAHVAVQVTYRRMDAHSHVFFFFFCIKFIVLEGQSLCYTYGAESK